MPRPWRRHCMVVDNNYPDVRVEREALALIERGYAVDVICLSREGEPRRERQGRLTVYRLPVRRRRGATASVHLREYLAFLAWATAMVALRHSRQRYDCIQVHNVPDFLVFSAAIPKLLGTGVILDLHDLMPEFFASRFGDQPDGMLARVVRLQERASAAFADRVVTVTDLWRATLITRGIPAEKVEVVMNLPDERIFAPTDPEIRVVPEPVVIIYHGTITQRYGLDLLVRAFAGAAERVPLRLLIHGRGEYVDEVRRWAEKLAIADDVEISTEVMPTADLPAFIRRADIGVVPYRNDVFTDGILPTKLMEYAALGIPSIVSRSSAVESYFTPDMVRFVEPGDVDGLADALWQLATDPDLRRSLATNAQRFTQQFRWDAQAAAYADLVDAVIQEKQSSGSKPTEGKT